MSVFVPVCNDTYVVGSLGELTCEVSPGVPGTWSFVEVPESSEITLPADWDLTQLDLVVFGQAFGAGFFIIASWWVLIVGLKQALTFINGRRL